MIQNLFLDAGGVILDETLQESARATLITGLIQEHNASYEERQYWADVEEAVWRFVPSVYRYIMAKNTNSSIEYDSLSYRMKERWPNIAPPLKLMAGLDIAVKALSPTYRISILGQYGTEVTELLRLGGLLKYFHRTDTQEDFLLTKPDPRYFEQVILLSGAGPESSIMVGDRIDKDIIPAKMIGMKTIRVVTGIHRNQKPRMPEEMADVEIEHLQDLPIAVTKIVEQTGGSKA